MENILLVGYGGHAKSIADCIERQGNYRIAGYTDSMQRESPYQYLGTDERLQECYDNGIKKAVIGVGYLGKGKIRETIYDTLKQIGFELPVISDPSAIISSTASVGEGTFIGKNVIVNSEAYVGRACIINTQALVEHECKIDDFSHIAVSAVLCGQVQVGRAAFIGANATVIQCMNIPAGCMIPAGVVVRNGYFEKGICNG